jgi:hypothetical protein
MASARLGLRGEGLFHQQVSLERTMSPSRIFTQSKINGQKNRSPLLSLKSAARWRGEVTSVNGENLQKMTKNFQDFQLPISLLITV